LTSESEINAFLAMEAEFHALAKRLDLGDGALIRALRLVVDDGRAAQSIAPCLTHNDFCAKHILVANAAISGIIDFGEVAGSEPLSDFVRWDYYDATRFPLAWLQEGYTNKQVFDAEFARRLQIKRIAFSLWVMRWYDLHGYAEGIADARAKFLRDLAKLEQHVT
jgi:aminoglycoside phosphotransferase (APT) family kinase protein